MSFVIPFGKVHSFIRVVNRNLKLQISIFPFHNFFPFCNKVITSCLEYTEYATIASIWTITRQPSTNRTKCFRKDKCNLCGKVPYSYFFQWP